MANKVKFGIKSVYYAKVTEGTTGDTYGTPVALPGAVSLSLDSQTENSTFYADNKEYFETNAKRGYEGDLEIALIPDSFLTDCLGMRTDSKGMLVESETDAPSYFALLFEFDGDDAATRGVVYKCRATSAPQVASSTTNESKEPVTDTISIKAIPAADGTIKARCEATATTAYNAWFTTVQTAGTFV